MKELIKKDIILIKKDILMIFLFPSLYGILMMYLSDPVANNIFFVFLTSMVFLGVCNRLIFSDKKNHMDALMMSLPIDRSKMVSSRYIILLAINVFTNIVSYIIARAYTIHAGKRSYFYVEPLGYEGLWYGILSCMIILTITMPFFYKDRVMSSKNVDTLVIVQYFFILIIFMICFNNSYNEFFQLMLNRGLNIYHLISIIIASILYFISYKISLGYFNNWNTANG